MADDQLEKVHSIEDIRFLADAAGRSAGENEDRFRLTALRRKLRAKTDRQLPRPSYVQDDIHVDPFDMDRLLTALDDALGVPAEEAPDAR